MTATVHASVALVGDCGVLVRGASGSGKSTLLLELIEGDPAYNVLVADDRVELIAAGGRVVASVPGTIAGLVELRGQGVLRRPHVSPAVIDLVVDLVPSGDSDRMPEPVERAEVAGIRLPHLALPVDCGGKPMRVRAALERMQDRKYI